MAKTLTTTATSQPDPQIAGVPPLAPPIEQVDPEVRTYFDPGNCTELITALIKAKLNFAPILKTKAGARGKYAPLPEVIAAIEAALLAEGIFVSQPPEVHGAQQFLATYLIHTSGQMMCGVLKINVPDDWQKFGSALSYARRYLLLGILCLAADDDDGQSAPPIHDRRPGRVQAPRYEEETGGYLSKAQQTHLMAALNQSGYTPEARRLLLQNNGGYSHPRDIPDDAETWEMLYDLASSPTHAERYNQLANPTAKSTAKTTAKATNTGKPSATATLPKTEAVAVASDEMEDDAFSDPLDEINDIPI